MNRFTGLILALSMGAVVGACASGGGAGGPSADGFRPRDNKFTRDAEQNLALAMLRSSEEEKQQFYNMALENAKQAIQHDSTNPQGYYVAGQAYAALGDLENADAAWDKAEELYPPFKTELVGDRENAWVQAYNKSIEELNQDNLEGAIHWLELADRIYQGRPEARLQLGVLYVRSENYDKAIEAYKGALEILRTPPAFEVDEAIKAEWASSEAAAVSNLAQLLAATGRDAEAEALFREILAGDPTNMRARVGLADALARQGKNEEAEAMYADLITRDDLSYNDYLMIGVAMFEAKQFERAADAFRQSIRVNPVSRDAHYNLVQALYMVADEVDGRRKAASGAQAQELGRELTSIYEELAASTEKVVEFDPLNRNILAYMARAYQALIDLSTNNAAKEQYRTKIQNALNRHEAAEVEMTEVNIVPGSTTVTVSGKITNLKVAQGSPIRIMFRMLDTSGKVIGSQEVTVTAPAANAMADFRGTVRISGELAGWSYERVQ